MSTMTTPDTENQGGKDQSISTSWSEDWARAEAKANEYEREQGDEQAEHDGEQSEEGVSTEESGSGQEGLEASGEAGSGEGESDRGTEDRKGRGGARQPGERKAPRGGRVHGSEPEVAEGEAKPLPRAERIKALRVQAEELGLEFDGSTVSVGERAQFREERRAFRARMADERSTLTREIEERGRGLEARYERALALEQAVEANDLDGVAKALGHETWNHLSESALRRQMNPEHRELMEHRRAKRQREIDEQKRAAEEAERARQAQHEEARTKYAGKLKAEIAALKDPELSRFADDVTFVATVLQHQEREWDGEETISVEEAARRTRGDAYALYQKLHTVFGGRAAKQPETEPTGGAESSEPRGKRPTKSVSQKSVAEASEREPNGAFDNEAWLRKWSGRVKESTPDVPRHD